MPYSVFVSYGWDDGWVAAQIANNITVTGATQLNLGNSIPITLTGNSTVTSNGANINFGTARGGVQNGRGVALVDLDNDGFLDLVLPGGIGNVVGVYQNDGTGHFVEWADPADWGTVGCPPDRPVPGRAPWADAATTAHARSARDRRAALRAARRGSRSPMSSDPCPQTAEPATDPHAGRGL